MGEYRTWYPSGTSSQSIFTLEGPSMVTAKAPEPTLVLLMMKSDSIPIQKIVTILKPCEMIAWYFIFLSYVSIVTNPKSYYLVIYNSKLKLFSCYWGCIHTMDRCSIPQWSTRAPPSVPPLAPHSHYPQVKLPQWLFFYTKQRNQEWIWQNNNIECLCELSSKHSALANIWIYWLCPAVIHS